VLFCSVPGPLAQNAPILPDAIGQPPGLGFPRHEPSRYKR
jgi:hypothetical protein